VVPESFAPTGSQAAVVPESFAPTEQPVKPTSGGDQSGPPGDEPLSDGQPLPRRSRSSASQAANAPVRSEPLRERTQPASSQPQSSVFDASGAPVMRESQTEPTHPQPQPQYQPQPQHEPQPSVFDPGASEPILPAQAAASPAQVAPVDPRSFDRTESVLPPTTAALPTLPVANPAAPPPVAAPIESAPSTPDISALRSAQLRANRQQHQGKLFGRTLLTFMVIGGLIAMALIFGRSYLFTTEWDATLTPVVDDIQESTGVEFDHTVPLVVQPADEYAANLLSQTIGQDWAERVPEWRALGIANGDITAPTVAAVFAERTAAYYDTVSDTVYQVEGSDPDAVRPALEAALLAALQSQVAATADDDPVGVVETSQTGLTGISTSQALTRRSVDAYVIRRSADEVPGTAEVIAIATDLPIPVAYEVAAVDRLGEAILRAAGTDPSTVQLGDAYPDAIYGVLGDNPVNASGAVLLAGDKPLADSVALGVDDWSLVWGARLPGVTVDRLAKNVTADLYQPISRSGATCFVAVFQTTSEATGTSLFSSMLLWAQRAPAGTQALATQLSPTKVQLEACDPGANIANTLDAGTVDSLIDRQLDRLDN
jgi:hypothetical protein